MDSFESRIVEAVSTVRREGFNTYNTETRVYAERMSDLETQEGALTGNCGSSQNGRGGLFFVLDNADLFNSLTLLLAGGTVLP